MDTDILIINRKPTHPGEMLREEFMPDYGLSVADLAERLGVSRQGLNEIVHERRAVSPSMSLRLGRLFGTTARYWLDMQHNYDLWKSLDASLEKSLKSIVPLEASAAMS